MSISWFARLQHRFGPPVDIEQRRRFLRLSVSATAGLMLSGGTGQFASASDSQKRFVIVGGGLAGLAAAFELRSAGCGATVVEAHRRLGGRVLSFNDQLGNAFVSGKNVEGGGELIGSNHHRWLYYADKFGLDFLDVTASELEAPIVIDGRRLGAAESEGLWRAMDEVFSRLNSLARDVDADQPWQSPQAEELDRRSVRDWLNAQDDIDHLTRRACDLQLSSDNGVATQHQSLLGLLACVRGGGIEAYWTESEVYRCRGGNQQLAHKLAAAIGDEHIITGCPVQRIECWQDRAAITAVDGRRFDADAVVLAIPPSVWHKIEFEPELPRSLQPQMGSNVKWLASLRRPFWRDLNVAPDALTDSFMSQCWEGTDGQHGDEAGGDLRSCLNCFSGGDAARQSLAFDDSAREQQYVDRLESIYPGFQQDFVASRYMDWPREAWTGGGYSFPAPGEVTSLGPVLRSGIHGLHFAGEHTSCAFVGYMEGGLASGSQLAQRLLTNLQQKQTAG